MWRIISSKLRFLSGVQSSQLTWPWHGTRKFGGPSKSWRFPKTKPKNHLLLLVSLIHGHLKTRLFTIKTSNNVGFGRPMVDHIYQISPRSRLGALSLPAEAAPVWWVVMSGASPCYKTSGLSKEILAFKINVSFLKSLAFFLFFVFLLILFQRFVLTDAVKFSTSRATLRWLSISTLSAQRWECFCWVGETIQHWAFVWSLGSLSWVQPILCTLLQVGPPLGTGWQCGFEFSSKLNPPFVERLQECRFLTL